MRLFSIALTVHWSGPGRRDRSNGVLWHLKIFILPLLLHERGSLLRGIVVVVVLISSTSLGSAHRSRHGPTLPPPLSFRASILVSWLLSAEGQGFSFWTSIHSSTTHLAAAAIANAAVFAALRFDVAVLSADFFPVAVIDRHRSRCRYWHCCGYRWCCCCCRLLLECYCCYSLWYCGRNGSKVRAIISVSLSRNLPRSRTSNDASLGTRTNALERRGKVCLWQVASSRSVS